MRSLCADGAQPLRSGCAELRSRCAAIAQWVRSHCAVGAQSLRSGCAAITQWCTELRSGAQPLRRDCAWIAHNNWLVLQRYAVRAQPLRIACAANAQ